MESIPQGQFDIWTPKAKKYLSGSVLLFCVVIMAFLVTDFFLYRLSVVSIIGTLILLISDMFESVNLWFSFNGFYRKFFTIIIFVIFIIVGLIFYDIISAVSRNMTILRITMSLIQVIYMAYGVIMIITSNKKIEKMVDENSRQDHIENNDGILDPYLEEDSKYLEYKKNLKRKGSEIENIERYFSPYFDRLALESSCMIYSPEINLDEKNYTSSSLYIEGVPSQITKELFWLSSFAYKSNASEEEDENINNVVEIEEIKQPYSFLDVENII
ncbi:hypothetical protein M9Y10_040552 [Tritrichomonas musculus]|uniref:Uncharacterized protein n=1 Tax=Tritrichomonas musculus TaxID=1915356 RepID=A0ABR2GP58_9EUKA